ncbi:hypothetical protein DPMN_192763 [Dreissena polymorpha]|uniref:protein-tyrosine-phosphatase n=1 Tax=Dreissena polymorpha TaxID=45954 RepID=A0A9D4BEL1_DREPO|nr:hypothetical protein DPMN_192763 [Dreissena polymorpha]
MFQIQLCPLCNFGARFAISKKQTELLGSYIAEPVFVPHEVLCEALCAVGEVLENTAFIDTPRTSDSLNHEYQHISKSHIPDREEGVTDGEYTLFLDGTKPDNLDKNADLCVVPDDRYRPVPNITLNTLGHNDYINAVYISTFGEKDRLILTQSAIVSSAIDFVRLLHDHVIRTVVTFVDEVEPYMPGSNESYLIGPFTATTKPDTQKQVYKESVVQFKYIADYEGFEVRIIRFSKWSKTLDSCNIKDLMSLLISVQESACRRLVVLQCRDGYSQSGLFAVLWCLVERCQRDGEVAVAEIVKMIRRRRKQVITNEAQHRFCH